MQHAADAGAGMRVAAADADADAAATANRARAHCAQERVVEVPDINATQRHDASPERHRAGAR